MLKIKKMNILGINEFAHDVSSAIVFGKNNIFAVEEERLNRKKKCPGHIAARGEGPSKSYQWCLKEAGLSMEEIDFIALSWDISLFKWIKNHWDQAKNYSKMNVNDNFSKTRMYLKIIHNLFERKKYLKENFYGKKIISINHHLAHASCSYRLSNFDNALVIILDGAGEKVSTSVFLAEKNKIKLVKNYPISQSLGNIYTKITRLLGLGNNGEGKTMALADYGTPIKNLDLIRFDRERNKFLINYYEVRKLEKYRRDSSEEINEVHKNIAATVQNQLEISVKKMVQYYMKKFKTKNICLGGGIVLNCKLNSEIFNLPEVEKIFIPPCPGDDGTSLGAALEVKSRFEECFRLDLKNSYLGPRFSEKELKDYLDKSKIEYDYVKNITSDMANELARGKIIGLLQNRTEFGPRALGARSILAHPGQIKTKDEINAKIKNREMWRPFAPIILKSKMKEFYGCEVDAPFMNLSLNSKPEVAKKIPSVVHIDNSSRIQTVTKENSEFLTSLIRKFYKKTSLPLILNTSFNDCGEPIVCSPKDAIKTFFSTGLEILYLENFKIHKKNGAKRIRKTI